jgi:hypothetical protein
MRRSWNGNEVFMPQTVSEIRYSVEFNSFGDVEKIGISAVAASRGGINHGESVHPFAGSNPAIPAIIA